MEVLLLIWMMMLAMHHDSHTLMLILQLLPVGPEYGVVKLILFQYFQLCYCLFCDFSHVCKRFAKTPWHRYCVVRAFPVDHAARSIG
jgi:hypothetical protein